MQKYFLLSVLAVFALITSCSNNNRISPTVAQTTEQSNRLFKTSLQPAKPQVFNQVTVSNGVHVSGNIVENINGPPLPSEYEQHDGITIARPSPLTLSEITTLITKQTGIPILIAGKSPNSQNTGANGANTGSVAIGPVPSGRSNNTKRQSNSNSDVISITDTLPSSDEMTIQFSGKLSTLLDIVTAHFNLAWHYSGKKITINWTVNKSFDVPALPIIASMSFNVGTGLTSSDENSQVSSVQSATTNSIADIWQDIENGLSSIIRTNNGSNDYSISMSTGVINVSADPNTIQRVASYIQHLNQRLQYQVAISVEVYSVALRESNNYDIDILGIFEKAGKFGIGIGQLAADNESPSVPNGTSGIGWALLDNDSAFSGSSALFQALSERGEVAVVTSASVTTLNGVPVPLQVGQERDYVSEIEVTTKDDAVTTEITTDTVSAGFNLHLIPRVSRKGFLTLQFGMNISELAGTENGFDTFTANGHTVQLRRINQRNFVQQVKIPHRKTLVLAGFEQVRSTISDRGTGRPNLPILGGGHNSSQEREIIVIAITPTVLNFGINQ